MFLLSYGFGFMSRKTAEELARTNSERAVIVVLAPVCADRFRGLPDIAARTATSRRGTGLHRPQAVPALQLRSR
jgi:hypothetical protein